MCSQNPENRLLFTGPVIIGSGPAGLFCAYVLAKHGYRPLVLERGESAEQRKKSVDAFWKTGVLNPESNVQFGEGGAGTFSDGKLNTSVKDPSGRNREVLRIFTECGAPEEILYDQKPHLGTDQLIGIVTTMRKKIEAWGGEVRFGAKVTDFGIENGRLTSVTVNETEKIAAETASLRSATLHAIPSLNSAKIRSPWKQNPSLSASALSIRRR